MMTFSLEGMSLCQNCPLKALLLVGIPLPWTPSSRVHSDGWGGPPACKKPHPARSEPDPEPRRCCLGFRFGISTGTAQRVVRLKNVGSGPSTSKPEVV
jgi:hypothetical protein